MQGFMLKSKVQYLNLSLQIYKPSLFICKFRNMKINVSDIDLNNVSTAFLASFFQLQN